VTDHAVDVTIRRAMSVARSRSLPAPVEISPKTISSAARPPISTAMRSFSSCRWIR
jgi:hypothetical protein